MIYFGDPQTVFELIAAWRVAVAAALGALLGIERSLAGKHAGMRTYSLVALGSALFVIAGILLDLWNPGAALDPSRIAASVVMGIGFIGSGIAFLHSKDQPGEITTAAGIWVAAGVGVAAGFGFYTLAAVTTALAVLIFAVLLKVENALRKRYGISNNS